MNQQTETHVICIERWKAMLTGPFAFVHLVGIVHWERNSIIETNSVASLAACANKTHFLIPDRSQPFWHCF